MTNRALVFVTMFSLCGALAGCGSATPATPTSTPTETVVPSPSTTPEATSPETRFDLDCDSVASTSTIASFIAEPIQKQDALANYSEQSQELPRLTFIEAVGGLTCDWSNGVASDTERGGSGRYAGVAISVLPDAAAQFATYQENYSTGDLTCSTAVASCQFDQLIDGYWLSISMQGAILEGAAPNTPSDAVSEFTDSVVSLVSALGEPSKAWTPPTGTVALGNSCESIISPTAAEAALNLAGEPTVLRPHGGWSIWAAATVESGGGRCSWSNQGDEIAEGSIAWLPAGAWAADRLLPGTTYPTTVSPAPVDGLKAGDEAFIRCADDSSYCMLDLVIGGNWVQVAGYSTSSSEASAENRALALAAAAVASIYS